MKQTKFTSEISCPTDSCLAQLVRHWPEDLEVLVSIPTGGNFWRNYFCSFLCKDLSDNLAETRLSWKTQMLIVLNLVFSSIPPKIWYSVLSCRGYCISICASKFAAGNSSISGWRPLKSITSGLEARKKPIDPSSSEPLLFHGAIHIDRQRNLTMTFVYSRGFHKYTEWAKMAMLASTSLRETKNKMWPQ